MDSFTRTAIKSVLSLITFFSKYLSSEQYEKVIKHVLLIAATFEAEVKAVLDVIS